ncbi:MAG: PHP domain-containing protein [Anaerolineales bacterium]|nr:PHP domain-containing protein [Anaerolineales bacterium]
MGYADLHIHTIYSYDGTASVPAVLSRAKELGLSVISITDHDEIAGSLKAVELASSYGVEAIPGVEITTADGDLLAYNITENIPAQRSLQETVLRVGELGGFCIIPHPMASGMGMKSLSALSIIRALRKPEIAKYMIGIEAYNATSIDRLSNHYARLLAMRLPIAKVGNSDAHVVGAIGLGSTEFAGATAADLISRLRSGETKVCKQKEWTAVRILGLWAIHYLGSRVAKFKLVY